MLGIAPRFDSATECSFSWFLKFLAEYNKSPPKPIKSLTENDAVRKNVLVELPNVESIIFFDHGMETALIGQDKNAVINTGDVQKLSGKKVYTMACLSAKVLGVEAYKNGCKEYWGAVESIGFTPQYADLFGEVYIQGAVGRFRDNIPIEENMKKMKDHFMANIEKTSDPWTKIWLQKDHDMWVCYHEGNPPSDQPEVPKSWLQIIIDFLNWLIGLL